MLNIRSISDVLLFEDGAGGEREGKTCFYTLHNHNFPIYRWCWLIVNNHKRNWCKVQENKLHTSCKFILNKKRKIYVIRPRAIFPPPLPSCSWRSSRELEPLQQKVLYHKFFFNDYTIINLQEINGLKLNTMFINKGRMRAKSYFVINFCKKTLEGSELTTMSSP